MKMIEFGFKFHWNSFPGVQLTMSQHWFKQWLGTEQATGHYLNQCWPSSLTRICGTMGRWINPVLLHCWHSTICDCIVLVWAPPARATYEKDSNFFIYSALPISRCHVSRNNSRKTPIASTKRAMCGCLSWVRSVTEVLLSTFLCCG